MGKHDAKQPKLNFDHKRSTRQGELEQGPQAAGERDLAADDQGEDLRTLMLEMRSSLRNIDTKLDNLATTRGRKQKRLDIKVEEMKSEFYTQKDPGETKQKNPKLMNDVL
ncbi:hypothetical protein NDU88_003244 [Pleurodeles waltl]|uniref:Uncharacterized protein n=1 Tax=Pleurodeles waltl TaxID=8319 RepID=A0AAV7W468_PLEWA|nr:hypothetical protein NDU88_003244 [Pleurodeles waltl]